METPSAPILRVAVLVAAVVLVARGFVQKPRAYPRSLVVGEPLLPPQAPMAVLFVVVAVEALCTPIVPFVEVVAAVKVPMAVALDVVVLLLRLQAEATGPQFDSTLSTADCRCRWCRSNPQRGSFPQNARRTSTTQHVQHKEKHRNGHNSPAPSWPAASSEDPPWRQRRGEPPQPQKHRLAQGRGFAQGQGIDPT